MSISEVNKLCHDKFIERYGNVVEHCSICAAAVWRNRPFRDVNQLHREICSFIDLLPDSGNIFQQAFDNKNAQFCYN